MVPLDVRRMRPSDVYLMTKWGEHTDPRFLHYNFPYEKPFDLWYWFFVKNTYVTRILYGGFTGSEMVGYAVLKSINWFRHEGELGISLNPDLLGAGYGRLLLEGFLERVFTDLPIRRVYLRTAHFNHRAQKLYKRVGFEVFRESEEPFESQYFKDEVLATCPGDFSEHEGVLFTRYIWMEIFKKN